MNKHSRKNKQFTFSNDIREETPTLTFFSKKIDDCKDKISIFLVDHRDSLPVSIGYAILLLHTLVFFIRFLYSLYCLDYTHLPSGIVYYLIWCVLPPLLYVYSTKYPFYQFYNTKLFCMSIILFQIWLLLLALFYSGLSFIFIPIIMKLNTDESFTKTMVLILCRVATQLPLVLAGLLLFKGVFFPLFHKVSKEEVLSFNLTHTLNPDADKPISYPMNIVRDIKTGKHIPIYTKDRFLHTLIDGTSGTGKTSSTILPAIRDDLDMHCKAEDLQKQKLRELEEKELIAYQPSPSRRIFTINDFIPVVKNSTHLSPDKKKEKMEEIQKSLDDIRLQYPVCGLTVLAPDDSLTDDVCRLCDAKQLPYNRIDTVRDANGSVKKNRIGMNPFYIPANTSPAAKHRLIVKKAVLFSDLMQAITDLKGKSDSYFTGINRQMISNIAILVMITVPLLRGRQCTPIDLQELINDFDLLPEYVDKLQELDESQKQYTFIIQYIREDLLGKGRTKMEDQSRGTRNIINEFLLMPENKEIFCAQTSIDFEQILSNGEITVCNYNLASGDTDAIAFGLFFLLSFNNAVLSRPGTEDTRIPHFFYLDELPVLIHPSLEKNFSLFRKFRVSMTVAIQTLDQMEKNELTKYLKGVILGCAHIIVFGRSSLSDMKIFSAMAGVEEVIEERSTTSETSLTNENPNLSYSSQEMANQKNKIEQIDIRMRDFQEVTFFTTRNGRPLPAMHGKVDFLKKQDWNTISRSDLTFSYTHTPVPDTHKATDTTKEAMHNDNDERYHTLPGTSWDFYQSNIVSVPASDPQSISQTTSDTKPSTMSEEHESIDDLLS